MALSRRTNLAQELHDGIAQDLVGLGYSLDLLLAEPEIPPQARIEIRTLRFRLTDILEKVRSEIHQLRISTTESLAQSIRESAEINCAEFAWDFNISEVTAKMSGDAGYQVAQIAREILRNISTHSSATLVSVNLSESSESLILEIHDNGKGGAIESPNRYGISGARTRAESLGAEFEIESSESGTRVFLRVPRENFPDS